MKNLNLFLFAAGAVLLTACGGNTEEVATEPVVANYTLDASASTLEWTGYKKGNEQGQHVGTINFTNGNVETTDEVITSGAFTINPATINVTDLQGEYAEMLTGHLKNPDFFDVEQYPSIEITVGELKDGKLPTTIKVTGIDFTQEVPVSVKVDGDKLIIDGEFTFDFEGIESAGFAEREGTRIVPQIDYKLHLELKK